MRGSASRGRCGRTAWRVGLTLAARAPVEAEVRLRKYDDIREAEASGHGQEQALRQAERRQAHDEGDEPPTTGCGVQGEREVEAPAGCGDGGDGGVCSPRTPSAERDLARPTGEHDFDSPTRAKMSTAEAFSESSVPSGEVRQRERPDDQHGQADLRAIRAPGRAQHGWHRPYVPLAAQLT